MSNLEKFSNNEIAEMVLFETKERSEEILKVRFPKEHINVKIFSNNDALITIGERKIEIKSKEVV